MQRASNGLRRSALTAVFTVTALTTLAGCIPSAARVSSYPGRCGQTQVVYGLVADARGTFWWDCPTSIERVAPDGAVQSIPVPSPGLDRILFGMTIFVSQEGTLHATEDSMSTVSHWDGSAWVVDLRETRVLAHARTSAQTMALLGSVPGVLYAPLQVQLWDGARWTRFGGLEATDASHSGRQVIARGPQRAFASWPGSLWDATATP